MDFEWTDTSDDDSSQSDSEPEETAMFDRYRELIINTLPFPLIQQLLIRNWISVWYRSLEVARSPSQDDIVSFLECPVCFELPLPPIRMCIQGHIICADCCCRLKKCPLCQQKIDIGRNFFAENFLNQSIIKCKFKVDGCKEELPGEKMKQHMQTCDFR